MIPDRVMKEIYMNHDFMVIPCWFQSLALDAFEDALKKTKTKIVEVEEDATIHES